MPPLTCVSRPGAVTKYPSAAQSSSRDSVRAEPGGGVRSGVTHGETDDYSVNVTEKPVHVHDLQATILHQLVVDHERFTFRQQGRYYRLTDVHGKVVNDVLT